MSSVNVSVDALSGGAVRNYLGDVGVTAGNITGWSILFVAVPYFGAGLLLSWRYYCHARYKRKEKEASHGDKFAASSQLLNQISTATEAASANFRMLFKAVLIPVVYSIIGSVVGLVMGMTTGSLVAAICPYANTIISQDAEITIGFFIAFVTLFFSVAPPGVTIIFL